MSRRSDLYYRNPLLTFTGVHAPHQAETDKVLVFDLDETLVHSYSDPERLNMLTSARIWEQKEYFPLRRITGLTSIINISEEGTGTENLVAYVLRPHLLEFLVFASQYSPLIIIWSKGRRKYVRKLTEILFHDLPAPQAVITGDDISGDSKPLSYVYQKFPSYAKPTNTFIIDNLEQNFKENPTNGILIPDYEPAPEVTAIAQEDTNLLKLMKWLDRPEVRYSSDVRALNKTHIFDAPATQTPAA